MSGAMWLVVRSFVLAPDVHRSKKLSPRGVEPGSPSWQARGLATGLTRLDSLCKIALVNCKKPVASRCIINNEWTWLWLLIKSRGDFYKWRAIHTSFTQRKTDVKFAGVPSRTQALVANLKCPIFGNALDHSAIAPPILVEIKLKKKQAKVTWSPEPQN